MTRHGWACSNGGRLLFNAPNRDGCVMPEQLWFEVRTAARRCDAVPPGTWRAQFGDIAQTDEKVEFRSPEQNSLIPLRRAAHRKWRKPVPMRLRTASAGLNRCPAYGTRPGEIWSGSCAKLGSDRLDRLVPPYASEFGLFVQMTKR